MLRHDAAWLLEQYQDEPLAIPGLPYAWLEGPRPWRVERDCQTFRLQAARGSGPALDYDEPVTRLVAVEAGILHVQRAAYSDGLLSNYIVDGPSGLRQTLRVEYGAKLPPLGDARLSNGIGTAVVVFDSAGRPYLPRRAPGQRVFTSRYHCTASGETVWTEAGDFDGVFTDNICRELEEEAGLTRSDLEWIRPLALCREFLRAGKPQLFFAAGTALDPAALTLRRRAAIATQLARGRQEILDDVLTEITPETLNLCTIECTANLALVARCPTV